MFGRNEPVPARPQSDAHKEIALPPSIHDLSLVDLRALHTQIAAALVEKEAQARLDFKREFLDRMSELGLTLDDLKLDKLKKERKKRNLPIRYRDPENPEHTWTGVGKPKQWLQDKLEQGHALDEFAVDGSSMPPN